MLLNRQFCVESHSSPAWRVASWTLITAATLLLSNFTLRPDTNLLADEPTAESANKATEDSPPDEDDTKKAESPTTAPPSQPKNARIGKYSNFQEAWSIGTGFYNAKRYAESRKPFEAALAFADDDKTRLKVYEVLRPSYRMISNEKKMMEACDFIIRHCDSGPYRDSRPHRSLTRRDLLSFVYQRGKASDLIARYEADLEADPKDLTALYILSETYTRYQEDPKRAAEMTSRLLALELKDEPVDVQTSAQLAGLYVRQKKYRDGAELFETIAPLDESLAAWHWKEAANAWLGASDEQRALAAAKKSAASIPEVRSQQLTYYWHRALGDVFLATGEPQTAVGHLEKAIENTKIDGYLTDCKSQLERAKRLAGDAD